MDRRKNNSRVGSKSLEEVLAAGKDLLQSGEAKSLLPLLLEAQNLWPDNIALVGMLAETYLKLGKYENTLLVLSDIVVTEKAPFWADVCYANALEKSKRLDEASSFFCSALAKKYSDRLVHRILRLLPFVTSRQDCLRSIGDAIAASPECEGDLGGVYKQFAEYTRKRKDYATAAELYHCAIEAGVKTDQIYRRKIFSYIRTDEYSSAMKTLKAWDDGRGKKSSVERVSRFLNQRMLAQPHYRVLQDILLFEYYRYEQGLYEYTKREVFNHFLTVGLEKGYNPNPWFSSEFFIEQYGEKIQENEPPLIAYLRLEGKDSVQPSVSFDPDYYRDNNSDLHGVKSFFAHYSKHGHFEGRSGIGREIPDAVVAELDEISRIEPKVVSAASDLNKIVRYPRIYRSLFLPETIAARFNDVEVVVCVPFLSRGGADLVSTYALRAIQQSVGNEKTLLIVTDQINIETSDWYRDDTNVVVLNRECDFENDDDKLDALLGIVSRLAPKKVLNVNSRLCWEMFREYGKQLSSALNLYAYLFCYDYDLKDRQVGYITEFLPETVKHLSAVFFDNESIIDSVKDQYGFSGKNNKKLKCIYTPTVLNTSVQMDSVSSGNKVLWIGRLARQKRPDTLIEIARALPSVEFHVYGDRGNSEFADIIISNSIENIKFKGTYSDIQELDISQYSLFLLTSQWEGIPTILITMMAFGVAVVTPTVGGIGELVTDDTGWPVRSYEDAEEYCRTIRQLMLDDDEKIRRCDAAKIAVQQRHCWGQFETGLFELGLLANSEESLQKVS